MDKTIIRIEDASVTLGEFSIKPINLEIPKGYIVGIRGANGAGKSVFLRMLQGEYPQMQGHIFVDGLEVTSNRSEMLQSIGVVSDKQCFFMQEDAIGNERLYSVFYANWNSDEYRKQL